MLPSSALPDGPDVLSMLFHVYAYAALAFALVWPADAPWWLVVAIVVTSALGTEALQSLAPGRSPDPWDVMADLVGGGLGLAAARVSGQGRRPLRADVTQH